MFKLVKFLLLDILDVYYDYYKSSTVFRFYKQCVVIRRWYPRIKKVIRKYAYRFYRYQKYYFRKDYNWFKLCIYYLICIMPGIFLRLYKGNILLIILLNMYKSCGYNKKSNKRKVIKRKERKFIILLKYYYVNVLFDFYYLVLLRNVLISYKLLKLIIKWSPVFVIFNILRFCGIKYMSYFHLMLIWKFFFNIYIKIYYILNMFRVWQIGNIVFNRYMFFIFNDTWFTIFYSIRSKIGPWLGLKNIFIDNHVSFSEWPTELVLNNEFFINFFNLIYKKFKKKWYFLEYKIPFIFKFFNKLWYYFYYLYLNILYLFFNKNRYKSIILKNRYILNKIKSNNYIEYILFLFIFIFILYLLIYSLLKYNWLGLFYLLILSHYFVIKNINNKYKVILIIYSYINITLYQIISIKVLTLIYVYLLIFLLFCKLIYFIQKKNILKIENYMYRNMYRYKDYYYLKLFLNIYYFLIGSFIYMILRVIWNILYFILKWYIIFNILKYIIFYNCYGNNIFFYFFFWINNIIIYSTDICEIFYNIRHGNEPVIFIMEPILNIMSNRLDLYKCDKVWGEFMKGEFMYSIPQIGISYPYLLRTHFSLSKFLDVLTGNQNIITSEWIYYMDRLPIPYITIDIFYFYTFDFNSKYVADRMLYYSVYFLCLFWCFYYYIKIKISIFLLYMIFCIAWLDQILLLYILNFRYIINMIFIENIYNLNLINSILIIYHNIILREELLNMYVYLYVDNSIIMGILIIIEVWSNLIIYIINKYNVIYLLSFFYEFLYNMIFIIKFVINIINNSCIYILFDVFFFLINNVELYIKITLSIYWLFFINFFSLISELWVMIYIFLDSLYIIINKYLNYQNVLDSYITLMNLSREKFDMLLDELYLFNIPYISMDPTSDRFRKRWGRSIVLNESWDITDKLFYLFKCKFQRDFHYNYPTENIDIMLRNRFVKESTWDLRQVGFYNLSAILLTGKYLNGFDNFGYFNDLGVNKIWYYIVLMHINNRKDDMWYNIIYPIFFYYVFIYLFLNMGTLGSFRYEQKSNLKDTNELLSLLNLNNYYEKEEKKEKKNYLIKKHTKLKDWYDNKDKRRNYRYDPYYNMTFLWNNLMKNKKKEKMYNKGVLNYLEYIKGYNKILGEKGYKDWTLDYRDFPNVVDPHNVESINKYNFYKEKYIFNNLHPRLLEEKVGWYEDFILHNVLKKSKKVKSVKVKNILNIFENDISLIDLIRSPLGLLGNYNKFDDILFLKLRDMKVTMLYHKDLRKFKQYNEELYDYSLCLEKKIYNIINSIKTDESIYNNLLKDKLVKWHSKENTLWFHKSVTYPLVYYSKKKEKYVMHINEDERWYINVFSFYFVPIIIFLFEFNFWINNITHWYYDSNTFILLFFRNMGIFDIFFIYGKWMTYETIMNLENLWVINRSYTHNTTVPFIDLLDIINYNICEYNEYAEYEVTLVSSDKCIEFWYRDISWYYYVLREAQYMFKFYIIEFFRYIYLHIYHIFIYLYDILFFDNWYFIKMKITKIILLVILSLKINYKISIKDIVDYDLDLCKKIENKGSIYIYYMYVYIIKKFNLKKKNN